jgi:hypothetical protein
MRIDEIINAPDQLIYHFTSGDHLRRMLKTNRIKCGASTHVVHGTLKRDEEGRYQLVDGKEVSGVSLTRDRSLDLLKTYAVAGQKPFRIGLNYTKLRQNYRIVPVRDIRYFNIHKAEQVYNAFISRMNYGPTHTDSNEAEEYAIGDIDHDAPPHPAHEFEVDHPRSNKPLKPNTSTDQEDYDDLVFHRAAIGGNLDKPLGGGLEGWKL